MTSMAEREARLLGAVYRTYGHPAVWTPLAGGAPLSPTVRHDTGDVEPEFGGARDVRRQNTILVRRSEVPTPAHGDQVSIPILSLSLRVIAQPRLEPGGLEWKCEAAEI